ncbi:hypothetical protein [Cryobacterium frigoriphilum]|uniref:hypothetical protein n=1 Tax=Cryobacterium frigoriphilum TaxID=1259150 RepID=UPI00141B2F5B|nr:hypothetical protein [Cryobacterium frigoriphilum]
MTPSLKLEDAAPVTTVAEAQDRVADLVGPAIVRKLWFMLLDRHGRQVPVLIPLEDIPLRPEPGDLTLFAGTLAALLEDHAPGGSVILTLERPGPAALTPPDRDWGTELRASFAPVARIMGVFMAHDDGVVVLRG